MRFMKPSDELLDLLAIDPGQTVGWAWFELGDGEIKKVIADQDNWVDFLYSLKEIVENKECDFEVLIENYTIRTTTVAANLNKELLTAKVIGVIEWYCRLGGIKTTFQPAGIGNQFFDKKRLKDMDLWVVGKVHARDATRHGLWHITFGKEGD